MKAEMNMALESKKAQLNSASIHKVNFERKSSKKKRRSGSERHLSESAFSKSSMKREGWNIRIDEDET